MNCQWVQQNLSAYIDNELSSTHKELIESHLSQCALCKSEFNRLSKAWDALSLWEDTHPPVHLQKSILKAIKKEKSFNFMRLVLPVAAALLISLSTVLFYQVLDYHEQSAIVTDQKELPSSVGVESVMVDNNEIINNLQLLEDKDFYDSVELLKTIDYLPLIEEPMEQESSLGYFSA